ncbi:MAG: hypothetical protein ABW076_07730 [Candidatus Thiodiazotropha sp.]
MKQAIMGLTAVALTTLSLGTSPLMGACVTGDTTEIYYVNGVWNTVAQARGGRNLIKSAYKQSLQAQYPEQVFEFKLAYNYHSGKVGDLIEVIGQKLNEIDDPEANKLTPDQYYTLYMTAKDFDDAVPVTARPVSATIEEYMASRLTDAVDSAAHIQKYRTDLQEGKRILLIAHSQGNMFANQAVSSLMNEYSSSIGMIGVASPAAVTYNNSTYYTAHDDRVIDALRLLYDVLPSNIENDPGFFNDPRDFSNHQFYDSYFATGIASRSNIDTDVSNYMASLQFPSAELGSGAITVTLTWGSEPDVDLHVTEPNGTHVYYVNLQGVSGYLDLDDTTSYGPEHYYVSCETLETGTYSVGVNYYRGEGPETAQVQVTTGDGNTRTFSQSLTEAVGSSGNSSPISVSTINVSTDQNGVYIYQVN